MTRSASTGEILGEIALKLDIDGRVARNPTAPARWGLQRSSNTRPQISDDAALKQRSTQEANTILIRLGDVPGLRAMLALALATDEIATQVTSAPQSSDTEKDVARQAKQVDLASHKAEVRRLLGQAVRGATIFFQGTPYQPAAGESPSAAIRTTLSQILPHIYPRFADVLHRISNEETAVKAALAGNTTNSDLQALGVYRADGTLNDAHRCSAPSAGCRSTTSTSSSYKPTRSAPGSIARPTAGTGLREGRPGAAAARL